MAVTRAIDLDRICNESSIGKQNVTNAKAYKGVWLGLYFDAKSNIKGKNANGCRRLDKAP